jgi:FkbM family methyltransferase
MASHRNIHSLKEIKHFRGIFFFLLLLFCVSPLPAHEISYALPDALGMPLDLKLIKIMNRKNGTFIEVGANDGIAQSNTKLLEEHFGWRGILIEPSPELFARLCANRPHSKCFSCALGSFDQDGTYAYGDFDGHLMSSFQGHRLHRFAHQRVAIRSLQSILDEVGIHHIDLFSLDTEGHELAILQGIDFNKTQFDYLLIEIYQHQYEEIVTFLSGKGYDMIESFTNYTHATNPNWDGTHNDYLFKRRNIAQGKFGA